MSGMKVIIFWFALIILLLAGGLLDKHLSLTAEAQATSQASHIIERKVKAEENQAEALRGILGVLRNMERKCR